MPVDSFLRGFVAGGEGAEVKKLPMAGANEEEVVNGAGDGPEEEDCLGGFVG